LAPGLHLNHEHIPNLAEFLLELGCDGTHMNRLAHGAQNVVKYVMRVADIGTGGCDI